MAVMAATEAPDIPARAAFPAFDGWMAAEQKRIFLLCLRLLRDSEDADTATQDTFLKAYRALERAEVEPLIEPGKWLTRIAVNTCLDRLRSQRWRFWRRRARPGDEQTVLALAPCPGPTPEQAVHARQVGERLRLALAKLPDRQRSVFVLRHFEDQSLQEIGALLGLEVGTVKAHLSRALVKLRVELRDLYGRQALQRG